MTIKTIEITFPAGTPVVDGLNGAFGSICRLLGPCRGVTSFRDEANMLRMVGTFEHPVEFKPGVEQALDAIASIACKAYERANPTMVAWPSGCGSRPIWSKQDAALLGKTPTAGAADGGEPTWDDTVYMIECSAKEDTDGSNPDNPRREQLRAERQARKAEASAAQIRKALDTPPEVSVLTAMAYKLKLAPEGHPVHVDLLETVRLQFLAARAAAMETHTA